MASASGKEYICLHEEQRSGMHKRGDCLGDPHCRLLIWGLVQFTSWEGEWFLVFLLSMMCLLMWFNSVLASVLRATVLPA